MYLLRILEDGQIRLEDFCRKSKPPYAILSHTWGPEQDEVSFIDLRDGRARKKSGYTKLNFCAQQTAKDNMAYFWVDTCCIDQTKSSEVDEAIRSMYIWYGKAERCYVYMSDVSLEENNDTQARDWMSAFRKSRWFERGWTLQELIAPTSVQFFSREGNLLGDKQSLVQDIHDVTGILVAILEGRMQLSQLKYHERISWMAHRETQKEEDRAYALQGILGFSMTPMYGEGIGNAMHRLQREFSSIHLHPEAARIKSRGNSKSSKGATASKIPDRHKTVRLLCRSYEPIVLLYTLGVTKQDHVPTRLPTVKETKYLPIRTARRSFLEDLAYLCDYDVGNNTNVAIALQALPQRHVLWIASNTSPTRRIIAFARKTLDAIQKISINSGVLKDETEGFVTTCIEFAAPQVEEDIFFLGRSLQRCMAFLERNNVDQGAGLVDWIEICFRQTTLTGFCHAAYNNQGSSYMHTLAEMDLRFCAAVDLNEAPSPFDLLRRHMIRLGRRFQAAQAVLTYGKRLPELRGIVNVSPVVTPPASRLPPPDTLTDLSSIVGRMLPKESPSCTYRRALSDMAEKHNLFRHFLDNYNSGNVRQYVHAEVQVLDLFYACDFTFPDDDNFIATSRPACFSCLAYFRSHPGRFVEPISDRRVCLNWRPAAIDDDADTSSKRVRESTMNDFNKFMRKEALYQILKKSSTPSGRPGFPHVARCPSQTEQSQKLAVPLEDLVSQLRTKISAQHWLGRRDKQNGLSSATIVPKEMDTTVGVDTGGNRSVRHGQIGSLLRLCPETYRILCDSDSEGGVILPLREMRW